MGRDHREAYASYMIRKEYKDTMEATEKELKEWLLMMQKKHGGDFLGNLTGVELKKFAQRHGIKIIKKRKK